VVADPFPVLGMGLLAVVDEPDPVHELDLLLGGPGLDGEQGEQTERDGCQAYGTGHAKGSRTSVVWRQGGSTAVDRALSPRPAALVKPSGARRPERPWTRGQARISGAGKTILPRRAPSPSTRLRPSVNMTHFPRSSRSLAEEGLPPLKPREKLRARGPAALSVTELIALLVGSGSAGRSGFRIARSLA